MHKLYHPGLQQQQQQVQLEQQVSVPAPPVAVAQVPPLPTQALGAPPVPTQVQQVQGQVQGAVATVAPQAMPTVMQVPAVNPQPQQQVPVNIQQPANPALQHQLYQAMMQEGNSGSVTMDDIGNLLLTSGRSGVRYRGTNASDQMHRQFQRC